MASLFGGKQKRVPTDDIYPAHLMDDTTTFRNILMGWTLRFNDVLDGDMLHASLSRLLEIGDWKKLGGRIRFNARGKLEYHVPAKFTPERPAVGYTHETFDLDIDEHPLASRLPKPSPSPAICEGDETFRPLAAPPDFPKSLDDYAYTDRPQLSLHIVFFRDATLVTLAWPHTMTDGLGRHALIRNWNLVLAGKADQVQPLLGARDDVLQNALSAPPSPSEPAYALQHLVISGFRFFIFVLHHLWFLLFGTKHQQRRLIFIPARSIAALRQESMGGLAAEQAKDPDLFISDGDILSAWGARILALAQPANSARPVTTMNVFDVRTRMPSIFAAGGAYVQNLAVASWAFSDARKLRTTPLGKTALALRSAIVEQSEETQAKAVLRIMRGVLLTGGQGPLLGEPNARMFVISNWTKGKFYQVVDFSPAVKVGASSGVARRTWPGVGADPGKPDWFISAMFASNPFPNVWNILGKDVGGNYWIVADLSKKTWAAVRGEIERL
ncbi:hypothetical protein B0T17DRAFT_592427 [Bombardia bombarda]|uniref:Uncharacterized protein n=1 Tax=Bombardia bombarda TaxID=252184 RepID=A0AA39WI12_9PEZI|nr:hypothetical protein B0T17DRAFT_592427 [Bombardia bombarda]